MKLRGVLVVAIVLAVLVPACGNDDSGSGDADIPPDAAAAAEQYVQALKDSDAEAMLAIVNVPVYEYVFSDTSFGSDQLAQGVADGNTELPEDMVIETGDEVVALMGDAVAAGVQVVAGDTKVLPRGQGGGLYLATTGVGLRPAGLRLGMDEIREGDAIVVSGPIGDHGIAVMLAREDFEISGDVASDCGNVIELARCAMKLEGLRFMRDPTRAGLAGVAYRQQAAPQGLQTAPQGNANAFQNGKTG